MSERCHRRDLLVLALALGLNFSSTQAFSQDGSSWSWSGDYKNLLLQSRTAAGDRYVLDRNRLRLAFKGSIGDVAPIELQYDNEIVLGDTVGIEAWRQQRDAAPPRYWSLQSDYLDRQSVAARHGLYRASFDITVGQTDIRIGRQRIAWGTGRFWSPLDLLNPMPPITLDRSERPGVDAVLVEYRAGPLSRAAAVYAPDPAGGKASRALLWHGNVAGVDYSVVAGRFQRERILGLDFAAQVGLAVLRGEWTRVHPPSGANFDRAVLGLDYAFANTLTLSAELYRDTSGTADPARYDFTSLASGQRRTLARSYLGLRASYDMTPLLKWAGELVINLDDRSRYFSPSVTWSLRPDLEWSFGVQHFSGSRGSELERYRNTAYTQWQWFF